MGSLSLLDILVVDDNETVRKVIVYLLDREGYNVEWAQNGETALESLQKRYFDLVISDYKMEQMDGLELLQQIKKHWPATEVVIITGYGSIARGVAAIKFGAFDYITKPFDNEDLLQLVGRLVHRRNTFEQIADISNEIRSLSEFDTIIGESSQLYQTMRLVAKVAPKESTCLISGESGTGKELFARVIHALSDRKDRPYVAINCSAIPENLMESEFFGHAKGAFTGATNEKAGLLEAANGGSVMLDEITELELAMQAKLLRCLQENTIRRIGENFERKVNFRLIVATNKNLEEEVKKGQFRQDLFYRINVIPIMLPTLRERKEDIPGLVQHFIEKYSRINNSSVKSITRRALSMLMNYHWPGNVRELENVIERCVALTSTEEINQDILPEEMFNRADFSLLTPLENISNLADIEREAITQTLRRMNGNRKKTAKELGISKTTLWRKLKKRDGKREL